jgi:hypothetical protein
VPVRAISDMSIAPGKLRAPGAIVKAFDMFRHGQHTPGFSGIHQPELL